MAMQFIPLQTPGVSKLKKTGKKLFTTCLEFFQLPKSDNYVPEHSLLLTQQIWSSPYQNVNFMKSAFSLHIFRFRRRMIMKLLPLESFDIKEW